jgi:hypothetical protein
MIAGRLQPSRRGLARTAIAHYSADAYSYCSSFITFRPVTYAARFQQSLRHISLREAHVTPDTFITASHATSHYGTLAGRHATPLRWHITFITAADAASTPLILSIVDIPGLWSRASFNFRHRRQLTAIATPTSSASRIPFSLILTKLIAPTL